MNWISVKDKLPDYREPVIIKTKYNELHLAFYVLHKENYNWMISILHEEIRHQFLFHDNDIIEWIGAVAYALD